MYLWGALILQNLCTTFVAKWLITAVNLTFNCSSTYQNIPSVISIRRFSILSTIPGFRKAEKSRPFQAAILPSNPLRVTHGNVISLRCSEWQCTPASIYRRAPSTCTNRTRVSLGFFAIRLLGISTVLEATLTVHRISPCNQIKRAVNKFASSYLFILFRRIMKSSLYHFPSYFQFSCMYDSITVFFL